MAVGALTGVAAAFRRLIARVGVDGGPACLHPEDSLGLTEAEGTQVLWEKE
jgi:hypothetical protein